MREANSLPQGWAWTTLGELLREPLRNGHSAKASASGNGIRTLTLSAVTYREFTEGNTKLTVAKPEVVEDLWLQPGDILIERSNTPELVGTAALYQGPINYVIFPDLLIRVRVHRDISERYIDSVMQLSDSRLFFRKRAQGISGTMPKIDQRTVELLPIPLAPASEQLRIVSKVDELLSDLDAGVAALKRAKANLKRYRAAVLKAAVTGELTAEWRAAHPNVEPATQLLDRILAERRQKWEAEQEAKFAASGKTPPNNWQDKWRKPVPPDTNHLPSLPTAWCWASFEQCASEVTVGHVGPMKDRYIDIGIPFLRSQNVRPLRFEREGLKFIPADFHNQLSKSKLYGRELLVVRSGNIGEACVYPDIELEANCADLIIARLTPGVLPSFAAIFVNSPFGRLLVGRQRTGSALSHFNVGAMERSPFPLPPLQEQQEIVAEVERQLSNCTVTSDYLTASLKRAERLRQSILKEAFAGRLVPQDPNDEPASTLLARIAQGRNNTDNNTAKRKPRSRLPARPTTPAEKGDRP